MLLSLLIAYPMEILMLLGTLSNKFPEFVERTTCTWPTLTLRNGSGRGVCDESHVLSRPGVPVSIDSAAATTRHLLHTDVAKEGDQVGHAPSARPIDVVGGKLLTGIGRRIEETYSGSDEGRDFTMGEGEE